MISACYAAFDHADWLEANIRAHKSLTAAPRRAGRRGWHGAPDTLSPFLRQVAEIIGLAFGGIYNAPLCWERAEWPPGTFGLFAAPLRGELATFDGGGLTNLALLAHAACIRIAVQPGGPRILRLVFSERWPDGDFPARHPMLPATLAAFAAAVPASHPVRFAASGRTRPVTHHPESPAP